MGPRKELINRIYVTNLPSETNEEELREIFAEYGEVLAASVATEQGSGKGRATGFVTMKHADAKTAIKALNGKKFGGRVLRLM